MYVNFLRYQTLKGTSWCLDKRLGEVKLFWKDIVCLFITKVVYIFYKWTNLTILLYSLLYVRRPKREVRVAGRLFELTKRWGRYYRLSDCLDRYVIRFTFPGGLFTAISRKPSPRAAPEYQTHPRAPLIEKTLAHIQASSELPPPTPVRIYA